MILPRILLPWTKTSDLSENSRKCWQAKHRLKQQQKVATHHLALEAGWHKVTVPAGTTIAVRLTYCPPAGTRYPDDDNVITAHKSARDVLASVLKVDDERFRVTAVPGDRSKNGGVIIDAEIIGFPAEGDNFRTVGLINGVAE